jgi:hypothetical protein
VCRWITVASRTLRADPRAAHPGITAGTAAGHALAGPALTLSSLSSRWLVGCGGSPHRELQVMSYTPQSSVDHAGSVGIRFDKPVVDDVMVASRSPPAASRSRRRAHRGQRGDQGRTTRKA